MRYIVLRSADEIKSQCRGGGIFVATPWQWQRSRHPIQPVEEKTSRFTPRGGGLICDGSSTCFFCWQRSVGWVGWVNSSYFFVAHMRPCHLFRIGKNPSLLKWGCRCSWPVSCLLVSSEVLRASFGGWKMRQKRVQKVTNVWYVDDFWQLRVWVKNFLVGSILLSFRMPLLIFCQLEGGQNNLWPRVVCGSTQFLFFS